MVVIDSHCHVSDVWYEPVETLLFQMDRNGVDGAVLIQILGQFDNRYQQDCLRRYPGRFASVVMVNVAEPTAIGELRRLAEDGASGVRLRPTARSVGDDPMAIWRTAADLGLSVSCPGSSADFASPEFVEMLASLPELCVVVEHLGSASRPDADAAQAEQRRAALRNLASLPNVYVKLPGLGEFAQRASPPDAFPFVRPIPDYLDFVYDLFGPERLMWGSDFPPVAAREGYARALSLCRSLFMSRPEAARELIFGEVAARVFPLR